MFPCGQPADSRSDELAGSTAGDGRKNRGGFVLSVLPRARASRRLGTTLRAYVMHTIARPTVGALVGLTIVFLTKDLLSFADFVINRGFGVDVVATIALYEIIPLATRTLPFAVLVGTLVGLGRLINNREVLALQAVGVAPQRLLGPMLTFAWLATVVGLPLSLSLGPWADRTLDATLHELTVMNPGLALRPGVVREFSGVKLVAREVSARGDHLRGVVLWIPAQGQILFAERGEFMPQPDGAVQLIFSNGVMLPTPQENIEGTRFTTFSQLVRDTTEPVRRNENFLTGASLREVTALAWTNTNDKDLAQRAQLEWHRRFSYPVANVCFGVLALALALLPRQFSRAAGGCTGLLATLLYYGLVQLGDGLVQGGIVSASAGVWLPNLILSALAVLLLCKDLLPWARNQEAKAQTQHTPRVPEASAGNPRFPRYVLPRYIARTYLQMLALSFAVLLTGYVLVDVLERLQWFAHYHAGPITALHFYSLWIPLLASRVVPLSILLATTLTVSVLSAHQELIGMRACGISALRALTPVLGIAAVLTPLYFVLNEVVLPRTTARMDAFKAYEIKKHVQRRGPLPEMLWWRTETQLYQATLIDPQLGEAQELSIYDLDATGLPVRRIYAQAAHHIGNGVWELVAPVETKISTEGLRTIPASARIQLGDAPKETFASTHFSVWELADKIREVEATGYDSTSYRVDWHVKLAASCACVLLPVVALLFALGGPPFPSAALTLFASGVLGVGQILLTSVCTALGYGGSLPPIMAGWAPMLILMILAHVLWQRSSF